MLLAFCALSSSTAYAGGKIIQENSLDSKILGRSVKYAVYLPDGYEVNEKTYPVLYLLHGLSDDYLTWSQAGDIGRIADREIASGRAAEMIIVMPDGGDHWYVNSHDGKVRYEDMFFEELIPHIEKTYKARQDKELRAIAGLSMGGQGALLYAIKHPEMFSSSSALSAAVYTDEDIKTRGGDFKVLFERIFGKGVATEHWARNSVIGLAKQMPDNQKRAVRFLIDCGDDDFLFRGNSNLHIVMREQNIPHEYRVRNGAHSWNYWREGVVSVLEFASNSFLRRF